LTPDTCLAPRAAPIRAVLPRTCAVTAAHPPRSHLTRGLARAPLLFMRSRSVDFDCTYPRARLPTLAWVSRARCPFDRPPCTGPPPSLLLSRSSPPAAAADSLQTRNAYVPSVYPRSLPAPASSCDGDPRCPALQASRSPLHIDIPSHPPLSSSVPSLVQPPSLAPPAAIPTPSQPFTIVPSLPYLQVLRPQSSNLSRDL
jgi:hypothetical protein